jgi:aspartyl-tRNA(Asn)/glutamyl-tRNA(Gln) amidotransferase subunit A
MTAVTAAEWANRVRARRVSVAEVADATLEAIRCEDEVIHAFTAIDEDAVKRDARALDRRLARGADLGPLGGVPIAIKDLIDVRGLPSSFGSAAFDPFVAERDATVVRRLRAAGALIVGKVRTTEFAWSQRTLPTLNPLDHGVSTGGSSSGPAAAIASGQVPVALGTDTGGSIRIPAVQCGLVGIKPTFGVVGRGGVLPANWTLDTVGPLATTCEDARLVLAAIVGRDAGDPWSARPVRLRQVAAELAESSTGGRTRLRGVRLGIVDESLFEVNDQAIAAAYERALGRLEAAGVQFVRFRLPEAEWVTSTLIAVDLPDAASLHSERVRDRGHEMDVDLASLIRASHVVPGALVARGHAMRRRIQAAVRERFEEHGLDALIAPSNPVPPVPNDDVGRQHRRADGTLERDGWALGRVVFLANVTGQPALTLPARTGLPPAGLQLIGRPYGDARVLDIGAAIERMLRA